jgi:hypothetical protein
MSFISIEFFRGSTFVCENDASNREKLASSWSVLMGWLSPILLVWICSSVCPNKLKYFQETGDIPRLDSRLYLPTLRRNGSSSSHKDEAHHWASALELGRDYFVRPTWHARFV